MKLTIEDFNERTGSTIPIEFINPNDCSDKLIYLHADTELGASARDEKKKLYPAWMLRPLMQNKMLGSSPLDGRVSAHANALLGTLRVNVTAASGRAQNSSRVQFGFVVNLSFKYQSWYRDTCNQDVQAHIFSPMDAGQRGKSGILKRTG